MEKNTIQLNVLYNSLTGIFIIYLSQSFALHKFVHIILMSIFSGANHSSLIIAVAGRPWYHEIIKACNMSDLWSVPCAETEETCFSVLIGKTGWHMPKVMQ